MGWGVLLIKNVDVKAILLVLFGLGISQKDNQGYGNPLVIVWGRFLC